MSEGSSPDGGNGKVNRVIDSVETQAILHGLRNSDFGPIEGLLGNFEGGNPTREEIISWCYENEEYKEEFLPDIIYGAKIYKLSRIQGALGNIEEVGSSEVSMVADSLSLSDCYYYDSFFGYTDHTTYIYKTAIGGALQRIKDEADGPSEAAKIFREYCLDNGASKGYYAATENQPAPLITNLSGSTQPRLVRFEDGNHIYVEFWTRGKVLSGFDIDSGNVDSINTVYRPYIRVHLDSGLIEAAGDRVREDHRDLISSFLADFNGNQLISKVYLGEEGIQTTRDRLAVQISLDQFEGDDAKLQFARSDSRGNVEADEMHSDAEENRQRIKSNFQLILGRDGQEWKLLNQNEMSDYYSNADKLELSTLLSDIEESGTYDEVTSLTVTLNRSRNTLRIHPKSITPSMRRSIFHMFADELGWR